MGERKGEGPARKQLPKIESPSPDRKLDLHAPAAPAAGSETARTAGIVAAAVIVAAGLLAGAIVIAGDDDPQPVATSAERKGRKAPPSRPAEPTPAPRPNPNRRLFDGDLAAGHLAEVLECPRPGVFRRLPVRPGGGYASAGFACNVADEALLTRPPGFYRRGGSVAISPYTSTNREIVPMVCTGPPPIRCEGGYEAVVYVDR